MKKALSFLLSALLLMSCLSGLALTASAEGQVLATLTPDDLATKGTGVTVLSIEVVEEDGVKFARFTTSGDDPYVYYNHIANEVGNSQFMKITYRTSSACKLGEYFCNSGTFANRQYDYVNDGEWHTIIIDLTQNSQHSNALQMFRLDPFTGNNATGCVLDVQSIEFFASQELAAGEYTLDLTTNPFADGIPSVNIGSDVVLSGKLVMPDGNWTSWNYSINGSTWAPASYEAGEGGAFENLTIPTNTLGGGIHTVSVQARNDLYQCVTLTGTIHVDISTVAVGTGNTGVLFENGTGPKKFGVRFDACDGLYSFTVESLATYSDSTDKMKVEAFAWNTDLATTTSTRPVWSTEVTGLADNRDATVEVPTGAVKGEVYLQFTPIDGNITPKGANESVNPNVEFYVDGALVSTGFMGYYVVANPAQLIWDLTSGSEDIDFLPAQDASIIKVAPGYIKAIATAEGACITNVGANLNPGFKYVGILYRTNTADATLSVNNSEAVALNTNGLWSVAYVDLDTAGLDAITDLAINFVGDIDIAYVGVYKSASLRAASANDGVAAQLNRVTKDETVYDAAADKLIDIGNMHSMSPVFVYDYSLWLEDAANAYGFTAPGGSPNRVEMASTKVTEGFVTFNITGDDPYFMFTTSPAGYANQLRYIVIKYRTTASEKGEFFTDTSGGYGWANPPEKTHVIVPYTNDGEWHTTIVDASEVWGDLYGQTLGNFRFDPIVGDSGSIDISYIAFYSNLAAAEAAAAADTAAPVAPVDPATVNATVFDGEGLFTSLGVTGCSGSYNYDGGYMTLYSDGADPNYYLFHNYELKVGPILAIKYRTTSDLSTEIHNEGFIGIGGGATGNDWFMWTNPIQNDGEWHIGYVNLADLVANGNGGKIGVNDDGTYTVNYFRVDFLRYPGFLDVQYIGFFGSVGELEAFDAQVWTAPKFYTVTFMADDVVVRTVRYREGSDSINVPGVPAKEGFTGEWEAFEMGKDVVVNAIYTEIPMDTEPEDTTPEQTTPEETTPEETEPTETTPEETTPEETGEGGGDETEPDEPKKGCKSALAAGTVLALASVIALGAVCFKKKD